MKSLLNRLRASFLYDLYWSVRRPSIIARRNAEVAFYRQFIPPGSLVFDIGANHGQKTDVFLRAGAGRVVAVDPDPFNCETLKQKFQRLRLKRRPVDIHDVAVSSGFGMATLYRDAPGSALASLNFVLGITDGLSVYTTTLNRLISVHGLPAFIKIDVEGHELQVLQGLSQPVPLSFEVNLPEHEATGFDCINRLETLSPSGKFNLIYNEEPVLLFAEWVGVATMANILRVYAPTKCSLEIFWTP